MLFALACAGVACQPQAAQTTAATVPPKEPSAIAQPANPLAATQPTLATLADSLTPEMQATLRRVDLSSLWKKAGVLDGFFGRDPQRLSLVILQAARDSLKPGLFHVAGKARYKKQVSSFVGLIQVAQLTDYYEQGMLLSQGDDDLAYVADSTNEAGGYIANARAYSASSSFEFTGAAPSSYLLAGRMLLDFWLNDKGKIGFMNAPAEGQILEKSPTKGSALVVKGNWQDVPGKPAKPFLLSRDIFLLSPSLIADFGIGDRGAQVNPKYVKQGWRNYWENDEWWADSPKPSLNL
ncbi:hypothetical protein [Hymenobacter cheonanensis]|uniref:hypothetical protein n=1 Tax=Hymenobacter sp. CA2-7 TaxID=3063993 RepID=UPI002713B439|nr:hypothetical protein [Hymenobacter sp. CA2-7]MDO7887112.1 hypothetical protein [Hymenobacter sp. CA2-7]